MGKVNHNKQHKTLKTLKKINHIRFMNNNNELTQPLLYLSKHASAEAHKNLAAFKVGNASKYASRFFSTLQCSNSETQLHAAIHDTAMSCYSDKRICLAFLWTHVQMFQQLPVIYDPVQTEVQRAKIFAPLDDFHHSFIVQFSDMTEIQTGKVSQLMT